MATQPIVPAEAITEAPAQPTALEQVAEKLSGLKPKENGLQVISAKSLGDVLPTKFYEGASELRLSTEELQVLADFQDALDDEIEIRPDGLIYASHIHYRQALTKIFGTEWALLPASPVVQEQRGDGVLVLQRWVLVVRGKFIGEAIGAGNYYQNNPKQNKSDAAEAAQSEALRRICAKSALGIGSNTWDRRFCREWRRKYAKRVYVKVHGVNEPRWRRIDDDPFEDETGDVPIKAGSVASQPAQPTPPQVTPKPKPEPPAEVKPPPPAPAPLTSPTTAYAAAVQPATGEPMATDGNFRLFMVEVRRRKLVTGEDAARAMQFLGETCNIGLPKPSVGKKQIELLRQMFLQQTSKQWNDVLLPALRAYQPQATEVPHA